MPTYRVAHVIEQGVDLIIIEVDSSYQSKTPADQQAVIDKLQACATNAGLNGTVVPVWAEGKNIGFTAPPNWQPFFKQLTQKWFRANANRELICH